MIRRIVLAAAAVLVLALPAQAQDFPKSPKIGPPEPLPEAVCDSTQASGGDWLVGKWVAPQAKWEFSRKDGALVWTLEQKAGINGEFGWREGAAITGTVQAISPCTLRAVAGSQGDVAFTFDGVLVEGSRIFGYATNKAGQQVRYVLRRER
jgi:hypothetical protein